MTDKDLKKVHPALSKAANEIIAEIKSETGVEFRVLEGWRSFERQEQLYNQKPKVTNSRAGYSMHQYGMAIDLCGPAGREWDINLPWNLIGQKAHLRNLRWGGAWDGVTPSGDLGHIELRPEPKDYPAFRETFEQAGREAVWESAIPTDEKTERKQKVHLLFKLLKELFS